MKLTKKQIGSLAGAVLVLFLMGRSCSKPDSGSPERSLYATVVEDTLTVTVRATGEILAKESNRIIPKIQRGTLVSFVIDEGARVKKDDVIAQFSTDELDKRISDAEGALADRELRVVSAQTDYEIQMLDSSNSLKVARQAVSDAEMELKKFMEGDEPNELRDARLKIDTSISKHERSVRKHEEAEALLKDGFITEDQVEEERIAMETSEVEAESARLKLQMLELYDLPLRKNKSTSSQDKARTELEKTMKKNSVQERRTKQELDSAIRLRDRAIDELEKLRDERKEYEILAPTDGVVNYGDPKNPWRRRELQAGVTVNPGEVMMTIPDLSAMEAIINVSEADVDKVMKEQVVEIYVEAIGRKVFKGSVDRIAEVANPGHWISSDVKEFKVNVSIENGEGLRPGYSCDAEIVVDEAESVLQLPIQAVFRDGDDWVVYKGSTKKPKKIPVEIGRVSVTHVEILAGVEKGDRVLLNPPEDDA